VSRRLIVIEVLYILSVEIKSWFIAFAAYREEYGKFATSNGCPKAKKAFQLRGGGQSPPLTRSFALGPHWAQTPIIDSCSPS